MRLPLLAPLAMFTLAACVSPVVAPRPAAPGDVARINDELRGHDVELSARDAPPGAQPMPVFLAHVEGDSLIFHDHDQPVFRREVPLDALASIRVNERGTGALRGALIGGSPFLAASAVYTGAALAERGDPHSCGCGGAGIAAIFFLGLAAIGGLAGAIIGGGIGVDNQIVLTPPGPEPR